MGKYKIELIEDHKSFGGYYKLYKMKSEVWDTWMRFAMYFPKEILDLKDTKKRFPALWYLHGATVDCSMFASGCSTGMKATSEKGMILVFPDTSPKGEGIEDDKEDPYLGINSSWYIDAKKKPWKKNYQMYTHIVEELRDLVERYFPVDPNRQSIFGHSMGGHGAIIMHLRNPGMFLSCSALAPVSSLKSTPFGAKALKAMLGDDNEEEWDEYDAADLLKKSEKQISLKVDQGTGDVLLPILNPEALKEAAEEGDHDLDLKMREGYDHGPYFVNTFVPLHIEYHWEKFEKQGSYSGDSDSDASSGSGDDEYNSEESSDS